MASQEVAQRNPQAELVAQVRSEQFRSEVSLALPENVTPARFVRVAITALQANPAIAELERASVMRALLQSASMGLMPDGREAAIVPFKGKGQLIPMVAGFRKIAADYGWTIYTTVVHEHDEFVYEQGLDVRFVHRPVRPGQPRGEMIAAYAVGKHQDGRRELEVLTIEEIEKIRATSQTAQKPDGPWVNWYEQMAEKSAAKRLFKKLPLSEDDKRVRIVRAAREPEEAAAALYGPTARAALAPGETVDLETGEVSSADEPIQRANGPTDGGAPDVDTATQQAGGASTPPDAQASAPSAPSAPEPDLSDEVEKEEDPGAVVIPDGANKGLTLAQVQAKGRKGEEWLKWAAQTPASSSVGPEVHAALQRFKPELFGAES